MYIAPETRWSLIAKIAAMRLSRRGSITGRDGLRSRENYDLFRVAESRRQSERSSRSLIRRKKRGRVRDMSVIVEIRAAEGGNDAKLLVQDQFAIYAKVGVRRSL